MNDDRWSDLRTACTELESGAVLETPVSERRFDIVRSADDRIVVRYADSGETHSLWREQFDVLTAQLADDDQDGLGVETLQPSVEPYAVLLTLSGTYTVTDNTIRHDDEAVAGESPYLVSAAEARTQPERVHDDGLLLAALLDGLENATEPGVLETDSLTDLYVLASDVQHGADRLRQSARNALLDRLGPDQELHGRYGTVRRTVRERRRPMDEETIFEALDEHDVPREWVLGVDREKLDVVLSVTDLTEDEVYETDESVYVQKTGVDEEEKYSRLQGLVDQLDALEGEEGAALREELAEIESRLEAALAGG
ncbi:DUF2800 family protein [Natrialba magadii ATCC 43099]|uniref:DUF2800 family protein n=1 Tax=Natrialba magadii (strain ATCC 43099 / DSM 3394 / CCM 3739 / CIP 104546 / IAM 13178 / JCM 8861 / NBRC 102185 / NCIMB 2190 / MS3) TaxID=547559 RepID=D3SYN8_NATMM|nr:hypothetical protein [Natrialba magadii]ADD04149.1 DUF2800 family protein [Natrialba magadii ATCC 43099]ELY32934.1 hypothetical protein C500_03219 [Natrialba magadii ATCC 43099]